MLTNIALILLSGLLIGKLFSKFRLPSLIGMILIGIILSPHAFNLTDPSILMISADLRQIALIIILTRAGLSLNVDDLKKVGRPAILMCFVPATMEIIGTILLAPKLLGVTILEAAMIGSVIAAVSPAVIVPRMIKLMEEGYGKDHRIPQLILAGASVDDIFVIVIFTSLISLSSTGSLSVNSFLQVPISILSGIGIGCVSGMALTVFFKNYPMRDAVKSLVILSSSFLLIELQNRLEAILPISGLLAIMSLGIAIKQKDPILAKNMSNIYNQFWIVAEIFLFVLVGTTVDLRYVTLFGIYAFLLVIGALLFRMIGVLISITKTNLTKQEKLFCMIAYTPKATVQAAIGSIPLTVGIPCGEIVLTVAVLSILITAPIGAIFIDNLYKKLLDRQI